MVLKRRLKCLDYETIWETIAPRGMVQDKCFRLDGNETVYKVVFCSLRTEEITGMLHVLLELNNLVRSIH